MKTKNFSHTLHSFEELKRMKARLAPKRFPCSLKNKKTRQSPEDDQKLFQKAMSDVTPLCRDNHKENLSVPRTPKIHDQNADVMDQLTRLIENGEGFVVEQTPEYIEGTGYKVKQNIAKRLHQGDFSIEAHLDLHGLHVEEATEVFDNFMNTAIRTGKSPVLIVHGRGLSSPEGPVLKRKVIEWLTQGRWRKWVLAYTSARLCDGGAGATYVLLRAHPATKQLRTKRNPGRYSHHQKGKRYDEKQMA